MNVSRNSGKGYVLFLMPDRMPDCGNRVALRVIRRNISPSTFFTPAIVRNQPDSVDL